MDLGASFRKLALGAVAVSSFLASGSMPAHAQAATTQKPNILFIMGDDIGWMQVGLYHEGLGLGETPNIDRIGREGAKFMDYLAMQSCTSGRNAFFTGMYPLRTGMIPPQLPGSPAPRRSLCSCVISATPPASSARTTLATTPRRYLQRTASRSFGAISI